MHPGKGDRIKTGQKEWWSRENNMTSSHSRNSSYMCIWDSIYIKLSAMLHVCDTHSIVALLTQKAEFACLTIVYFRARTGYLVSLFNMR